MTAPRVRHDHDLIATNLGADLLPGRYTYVWADGCWHANTTAHSLLTDSGDSVTVDGIGAIDAAQLHPICGRYACRSVHDTRTRNAGWMSGIAMAMHAVRRSDATATSPHAALGAQATSLLEALGTLRRPLAIYDPGMGGTMPDPAAATIHHITGPAAGRCYTLIRERADADPELPARWSVARLTAEAGPGDGPERQARRKHLGRWVNNPLCCAGTPCDLCTESCRLVDLYMSDVADGLWGAVIVPTGWAGNGVYGWVNTGDARRTVAVVPASMVGDMALRWTQFTQLGDPGCLDRFEATAATMLDLSGGVDIHDDTTLRSLWDTARRIAL